MTDKSKNLLLVDDNRRYGKILTGFFEKQGYSVEYVRSAKEALVELEARGMTYYNVLVTDITMENQLAGLLMVRKLCRRGYQGTIIVTSTAFNMSVVLLFSRLFLSFLGVRYLIPKASVLEEKPLFYPMSLFSDGIHNFEEVL